MYTVGRRISCKALAAGGARVVCREDHPTFFPSPTVKRVVGGVSASFLAQQ